MFYVPVDHRNIVVTFTAMNSFKLITLEIRKTKFECHIKHSTCIIEIPTKPLFHSVLPRSDCTECAV